MAIRTWKGGDFVRVTQDDGVSYGVVVRNTRRPTVNETGEWIDIERGCGVEGMPSYLLSEPPTYGGTRATLRRV